MEILEFSAHVNTAEVSIEIKETGCHKCKHTHTYTHIGNVRYSKVGENMLSTHLTTNTYLEKSGQNEDYLWLKQTQGNEYLRKFPIFSDKSIGSPPDEEECDRNKLTTWSRVFFWSWWLLSWSRNLPHFVNTKVYFLPHEIPPFSPTLTRSSDRLYLKFAIVI